MYKFQCTKDYINKQENQETCIYDDFIHQQKEITQI